MHSAPLHLIPSLPHTLSPQVLALRTPCLPVSPQSHGCHAVWISNPPSPPAPHPTLAHPCPLHHRFWRYGDSKMANVMCTAELQKRLADRQVAAVSGESLTAYIGTSMYELHTWSMPNQRIFCWCSCLMLLQHTKAQKPSLDKALTPENMHDWRHGQFQIKKCLCNACAPVRSRARVLLCLRCTLCGSPTAALHSIHTPP